MSGVAQSRRSPEPAAKQRSQDGVSSAAAPPEHSTRSALDTGGWAPLPTHVGPSSGSERRLLTADEVAGILRVPRSFVYTLARRGELPTVRIGERYVRFRASALETWIASQESTTRIGTQ